MALGGLRTTMTLCERLRVVTQHTLTSGQEVAVFLEELVAQIEDLQDRVTQLEDQDI